MSCQLVVVYLGVITRDCCVSGVLLFRVVVGHPFAAFDDGFSSDCVIFADYSDYRSLAKVDCSLTLNACEL